MILTAHQPAYLPWLGLFHKIALADVFISMDMVQYQTNDWNNRNKIKMTNGTTWLSVPVKKKERFAKPFIEIEIDHTKNWKKKHWASILQFYKKAPYFKKYADHFEAIYNEEYKTLCELNHKMLGLFLQLLGIKTQLKYMQDYNFKEKKSELILEMCQKFNASMFVFGANGKNYADPKAFQKNRIETYFQNYAHPNYDQQYEGFEPYLSVIDLLFNCGDNSLEILMSNNTSRRDLKELCLI